jgi:hypothetical protein
MTAAVRTALRTVAAALGTIAALRALEPAAPEIMALLGL